MKTRGPLVLIIDDELSIRDGCRQTLEKSGYTVLSAVDGSEGIMVAREMRPDVALIDLKMPGMSGMEIIEILSRDLPDVVLIMITGHATIVSAVEAIQKGTYDYLPKPFSPDQLRAVTGRAIERRSLKIEARRLKEEKERMEKSFITFVSHEMRSPLVAIHQCIEALKVVSGGGLNGEMMALIERCLTRVGRLEGMIEHWLDIGRIGEGAFALKKVTLRLEGIVSQSVEEMAGICRERGIGLEADVGENLPEIIGDEESLVRVLTNIVGNAAKYTPRGGVIRVGARRDGSFATISIADTGTGIPSDKLPFIFEPFYRVKGKEERERGSGLGLTFCKKIIDAHGGGIDVSSKEGQGTTFLLKIPLPQGSQKDETGRQAVPPGCFRP